MLSVLLLVFVAGCIDSPLMEEGPSGGGRGGGGAPPDTSGQLPTVSIRSAAAGDGEAFIQWEAADLEGNPLDVGLFQGSDAASLYLGAPVATSNGAGEHLASGLTNGTDVLYGLALDTSSGFEPLGQPVALRPSSFLFHVDSTSTCGLSCGGGPGDPFPDILTAVLVASSFGGAGEGANVWVREGTYTNVALPLRAGVHLYGGFGAGFDLSARDSESRTTVLVAQVTGNKPVVEISDGKPGATLDGFCIDGGGSASAGVAVDNSPARLASLDVEGCAGRGIRLRSVATSVSYDVLVQRCRVRQNGAEGLSLEGAFELEVEGSLFSVNALEGLDLDDLVAPAGVPSSLHVRDSVFFGNGAEGLDCDLGPPPLAGGGSSFDILVEGSSFARNGWKAGQPEPGLNIDIDFEGFPAWSADVLVRGSTARANRGSGFALDLDGKATCFLHRLLATGNGLDGVRVSSESEPGLAILSASVLAGNQRAGVRAFGGATAGNVPIALAHCIVAGNALGGVLSNTVESIASSSAAWLQPTPWGGAAGTRAHFVVSETDAGAPLFLLAPEAYTSVISRGAASLSVADASLVGVGDLVEVAEDGVARLVGSQVGPDSFNLAPFPDSLDVPALLARFPPGLGVQEDYRLAPGSAASGAGMPPTTGPAGDAGTFGATLGGAPGSEDALRPTLFRPASTNPPSVASLGAGVSMRVRFLGGTLDSVSIPGNVSARRASGTPILLDVAPFMDVGSGELVVPAPSAGWPQGTLILELQGGLGAVDGTALATSVALSFQVP